MSQDILGKDPTPAEFRRLAEQVFTEGSSEYLEFEQRKVLSLADITKWRNNHPIQFVRFEEDGNWITKNTEYFELRVPAQWKVQFDEEEDSDETNEWTFEIRNADGDRMFGVTVKRGGPEFFECSCGGERNYSYSSEAGCQFWAGEWQGLKVFKVSCDDIRMDIHAITDDVANPDRIRYIVESLRPRRAND